LERDKRVTLGPTQLIENKVARNFQQPGREFGARDISAGTFPDTDKDLLRNIFDI
jgi:hypothetical protein